MSINETGLVYERPWGTYQTLNITDQSQTKVITVTPGGRLSLQRHFKRSEHWIVTQGIATITIDDHCADYQIGQHVFIPVESVHRLENKTQQPVKIIEVQIGDYLGEDDIERLEDIYQRI